MAYTISYIIEATDHYTAVAKNISNVTEKMSAKLSSVGRNLSLKLAAPLGLVAVSALKASSTVEQLAVSFNVLLHSAKAGSELMEDLSKFTLQTTYQLPQIAAGAKIMLGFGMSLDQVKDSMTSIADVASGTNIPFQQMASYLGRVASMGHLTGRELYMMGMVGVPVAKTFSKELGITSEQFTSLVSEGKITLPIFLKLFKQMSEKGGAYYQMAQKQAGTLAGRWSVLKHELFLINKGLGDTIVSQIHIKGGLKGISDYLLPLADNFKKITDAHPILTKIAIDFGAIAIIVPPLLIAIGALGSLLALAISPISILVVGIGAAIAGMTILYHKSALFRGVLKDIARILESGLKPFTMLVHGVSSVAHKAAVDRKRHPIPNNGGHLVGGLVGKMIHGSNSNATVDVNLNAPQGTIQNVKASSNGFSNFNLGKNMVKATI